MADVESYYKSVLAANSRSRLVPFFGSGVNLGGRSEGAEWRPGRCGFLARRR